MGLGFRVQRVEGVVIFFLRVGFFPPTRGGVGFRVQRVEGLVIFVAGGFRV